MDESAGLSRGGERAAAFFGKLGRLAMPVHIRKTTRLARVATAIHSYIRRQRRVFRGARRCRVGEGNVMAPPADKRGASLALVVQPQPIEIDQYAGFEQVLGGDRQVAAGGIAS